MQIKNLILAFWNKIILKKINTEIKPWEFVFVIGKSWSWKTSFIRSIIWDFKPKEGEIIIDDNNSLYYKKSDKFLSNYRKKIWVVFQDYKLLNSKTVYENVAFWMEVCWYSNKEIKQKVPNILKQVGLLLKKDKSIFEISGWEKQRVTIARALVNEPELIIWDEPTWNLDPETADKIMELFEDLNKLWKTIIIATHDKNLVNKYKKRVITFKNKEIFSDENPWNYNL
jgi:cell division transport system ATP-binding protein